MRSLLLLASLAAAAPALAQTTTAPAVIHQESPRLSSCGPAAPGTKHVVVIHARVDVEGKPQDVGVETTSGDDCYDARAVEAVEQYAFRPATKNGKPRPTYLRLEVKFESF